MDLQNLLFLPIPGSAGKELMRLAGFKELLANKKNALVVRFEHLTLSCKKNKHRSTTW